SSVLLRSPCPPALFPYTTLFRSPGRDPLRRRVPDDRLQLQPGTGTAGAALAGPGHLGDRRARAAGRATAAALRPAAARQRGVGADRKSTRLNSSHVSISYAVFCL